MKRVLAAVALLAAGLAPLEAQQALTGAYLYTPPTCSVSPFSDVTAGDSYCPWIKQLKTDGITAGCGGGAFCPDAPVTHEQLALMLERTMRGTATWEPWRGMFKRVLIVSPVPGDNVASGQRLLQVVAAITDSLSNPYLVFLEPGTYDLGSDQLVLPANITLLGSGVERTTITTDTNGGAIVAGSDSVIDSLRVFNNGDGGQVVGIDVPTDVGGIPHIRRVTVTAGGGGNCIGIRCSDSCNLEDIDATGHSLGTSIGIFVTGGSGTTATMVRVRADGFSGTATYGMYFSDARGKIDQGHAEATSGDVVNYALNLVGGSSVEIRGLVTFASNHDAGATSAGVRLADGFLVAEDSRFESDNSTGSRYGLLCTDGTARIHQSRLIGPSNTVLGDTDCTIDVAGGQLAGGGVNDGGGTVRCALNYSENLGVSTNTCF
jgi:hypothetical protein